MFLNGRRCAPSPPRRPPSRLVAPPAGAPRRGVARAPAAGGAASGHGSAPRHCGKVEAMHVSMVTHTEKQFRIEARPPTV